MKYVELRVLASTGTVGEYLPDYGNLTFDTVWGADPSTIEFTYPIAAGTALGLAAGTYVTIYVDGTATNLGYVIEQRGEDELSEDGEAVTRWVGRSTEALLEDDFVWPSAYPNPAPQGHSFIDATPGTIVKTFLTRSQERGLLTHVTHATFSGTTDSGSVAWPSVADRSYATGQTILQVLQEMFEQGWIELRMNNLALSLYRSGGLVTHKSIDTICFTAGKSLLESSVEQNATEFATDVLLEGDEGVTKTSTDSGAYGVLGRRRAKYVASGGISDAGTLQALADAYLQNYNRVLEERTVAVPHDEVNPFIDYHCGDWVWFDIVGDLVELQIKQISVSVDTTGDISVGVTVGDLLDDTLSRLKRRIDAITGANSGTFGPVPVVTPETPINLAPAAPGIPSVTPSVYLDGATNRVAVTVTWSAVSSQVSSL